MIQNRFGEYIVKRRKEKKITLRGMADKLDLSPAYWSDIEKGRRNPPNIEKLHEIAVILSLLPEEIDEMIDLASLDRDEIPMDLPQYIKDSSLAQTALRKAKNMDDKSVTEKAWKEFIKTLEDNEK